MHSNIVKALRGSPDERPSNELEQNINAWKATLNDDHTNTLTKSTLSAVIFVAEHLKQEKAVLLPWVCHVFLDAYHGSVASSDDSVSKPILEIGDSNVKFSGRWLLNQLILYLHEHMAYKCTHRRFGIVLYRKRGDILTSLSWALHDSHTHNVDTETLSLDTNITTSDTTTLLHAGQILSDVLTNENKRLSKKENCQLVFNVDNDLEEINPNLVRFIQSMVEEDSGSEVTKHTRKVRIYFIICLLLYCKNPKLPPPLQNILADVVEVCSGSCQLLRILNRLGCTSSSDTHDRLVTKYAEAKRKKNVWDEIPDDVFTIATVDNFDMLKSHSAVYCGDQNRSYHGTTIQLVQPDPSMFYPRCTQAVIELPINRRRPPSPENSPHKLGKDGPKRTCTRTVVARDLTKSFSKPSLLNQSITAHQSVASNISNVTSIVNSQAPVASNVTSIVNSQLLPVASNVTSIVNSQALPVVSNVTSIVNSQPAVNSHPATVTRATVTLEHFFHNSDETKLQNNFKSKVLMYIFQKYVLHQQCDGSTILSSMRYFLNDIFPLKLQVSKVHYMELVNENPDSDKTMSLVAEDILNKFGSTVQDGWVVLVGDGKTYEHLMTVKQTYGKALDKLLIFPGDWHILKNFQPVIMKMYYHAGLRDLAKMSGFQGATLTSLENCSHFKRTHQFLLQVWEALYREMFRAYTTNSNLGNVIDSAKYIISSAVKEKQTTDHLAERITGLLQDSCIYDNFLDFIQQQVDDTWRFWAQFVFSDCLCYISLYLSIRGSNWNLRISSLKQMAPIFAALDRTTYERIIPNHLADIYTYPEAILNCLKLGGFTVNITGQKWHAVALDEAHEMCINKDLKAAVVRPTDAYLQKTTLFFNDRIKAYKNLIEQLFQGKNKTNTDYNSITDTTPLSKHQEENIEQMILGIQTNQLFQFQHTSTNRGIVNVFTSQKATPEQASDMLNFHRIGKQSYETYVKHFILKQPSSTDAKVRQHRLLTMKPTKSKQKKSSQKEKETKQVIQCLRRKLAWCKHNSQADINSEQQYSLYPRALADEDGYPHKGSKSNWTDKLTNRYKSTQPPAFTNYSLWMPEVVIIDAMFLIHIRPLRRTKTIEAYAVLLFHQVVVHYFQSGTTEVHLVFDKPGCRSFNPKAFEHHRRYNKHISDSQHHQHIEFIPSTNIPPKWQDYLDCRDCKRSIVESIGLYFLRQGRLLLRANQKLILSGCFSGTNDNNAWIVSASSIIPELTTQYHTNSQEADNRVWRHACQSWANRILIYSPDTDTYNIGLGLLNSPPKQYIVQINSSEKKYVCLNNLNAALLNDPDLATLPRNSLNEIIQVLFTNQWEKQLCSTTSINTQNLLVAYTRLFHTTTLKAS